jgi:hypothetical protein
VTWTSDESRRSAIKFYVPELNLDLISSTRGLKRVTRDLLLREARTLIWTCGHVHVTRGDFRLVIPRESAQPMSAFGGKVDIGWMRLNVR